MSSDQEKQILNDPQLEEYFRIVDEADKLRSLAEEATDAIKPTIEGALANAAARIEEVENDPEVRESLATAGRQAIKSLEQLDLMQTSVELGLVSEEHINEQRDSILSNPRMKRVIDFASSIVTKSSVTGPEGDSSESADRTPDEAEQITAQTEREERYPNIKIIIRGDGVQIGKAGRFIKLASKKEHSASRNFDDEKKALLKTLVKNAGNEMSPQELWDETFPGTEMDRVVLRSARAWFDNKLTYRRQPIVTHNGKRGTSSRYTIENPNVTIDEVMSTESKLKERQPASSPVEPDKVKPKGKTPAEPTQVKTAEDSTAPVNFPLNHAESIMLVEFLDISKSALESADISAPDKAIRDSIRSNSDTQIKILTELQAYEGSLEKAREGILKKIVDYFEGDQESILRDISNMSEEDNRSRLFEYLFEFETEQRRFLLETLAQSTPIAEWHESGGSFTSGVMIEGAQCFRIGPDGEQLVASAEDNSLKDEHAIETTREPQSEEEEEEEAPDPEVEQEILTTEETAHTESLSSQESVAIPREEVTLDIDHSTTAPTEQADLTEVEVFEIAVAERIDEVLELIDSYSLEGKNANSIIGLELIGGVKPFRFMTASFVKNAGENGHLSKTIGSLSKKDIVTLTLKHEFPKAFSVKKSAKKPSKRIIDKIIREKLEES